MQRVGRATTKRTMCVLFVRVLGGTYFSTSFVIGDDCVGVLKNNISTRLVTFWDWILIKPALQ